jgi:hypothetical protein
MTRVQSHPPKIFLNLSREIIAHDQPDRGSLALLSASASCC